MEEFKVQKNREEIIGDAEIGALREELENIKKEAEEKSEAKERNFKNMELIGLDLNQLTKPDWFVYKLFKEGKLNLKILGYHRKETGMEGVEKLKKAQKKGQKLDFMEFPRENFLGWIGNKFAVKEAEAKNYEILRRKIAKLKKAEMAKKEKDLDYNPHFEDIDPAVLTEEDLDKYQKYLGGTLTEQEFSDYKRTFQEVKDMNDSRLNFMAWLANAVTSQEWIKKWYPDVYKKYFENEE